MVSLKWFFFLVKLHFSGPSQQKVRRRRFRASQMLQGFPRKLWQDLGKAERSGQISEKEKDEENLAEKWRNR